MHGQKIQKKKNPTFLMMIMMTMTT